SSDLVHVSGDGKVAAIVEVNSETDFVAKNEQFQDYVAAVVTQATKTSAASIDEFLEEPWELDTSKTVKDELSTQISIIGENMNIRRFEKITSGNGFIESYVHAGGRIGVLVEMDCDIYNEDTKEVAKNIAMQVAAIAPKYVNRDEVPQDYLERE